VLPQSNNTARIIIVVSILVEPVGIAGRSRASHRLPCAGRLLPPPDCTCRPPTNGGLAQAGAKRGKYTMTRPELANGPGEVRYAARGSTAPPRRTRVRPTRA